MLKRTIISLLFVAAICLPLSAQTSSKLSPTVTIGSQAVDYDSGLPSATVNTPANAFDGDMNTFYASYNRSNTWVGVDLGKEHIITKVACCPRSGWANRLLLGVFEGANNPDFGDAIPLLMITEIPAEGKMTEYTINCSKGFRYVRYVGPNDKRCNIAEIEFYGYAGEGDYEKLPQITNLPSVVIHTVNGANITDKVNYVKGFVSFISNEREGIYTDSVEIRGRGNASWWFEKKPYRLKLYRKANVFNLPAKERNWTLISNHGDKTLMRNYLAFDLSRRLELDYSPAIKYVNLFLNGEYKGCYQFCDHMEVAKGRVEVEEMKNTDVTQPNLSGGYLVEIDAYASGEALWFSSNRGVPVTIKYPKDDEIVSTQTNYIKAHFNAMETAWMSGDYKYVDMESFIRHFLVGEISGNTDTYWSVYMYKKRNDNRFYFGPVWDFDLAYENDNRTYPINENPNWVYASKGSTAHGVRAMVNKLFEYPEFVEQLKSIYSKYRDTKAISEEALLAVVDASAEALDESQKLNFTRWNIMNSWMHQNPVIHGSYEAEVENVRNYIRGRIAWMDDKLDYVEPPTPPDPPDPPKPPEPPEPPTPPEPPIGFESTETESFKAVSVWAGDGKIFIDSIKHSTKVEVIAAGGNILFTQIAQNGLLETPTFPKGFYIVRISDPQGNSRSVKCIL